VEIIAQQLSEIKSRRAAIQSEVANAEATLARIDSVFRSDFSIAAVDGSILEASNTLAKLRSRYLDLVNQEAELTSAASHDHSAEVNVRKQIEQVHASIKEELKRIAAQYQSNRELAKNKERAIEEELTQKTARAQSDKAVQIKLRELENTAKNLRTTYDDNASFLQRDIEQLQQQSMPTSGARIVSLALPPLKRSYPKTFSVIGGAGLAGLILGFAIGLFRDMADRTFRSREQVETILEPRCIVMVPNLDTALAKKATPNKYFHLPHEISKVFSFLPAKLSSKFRDHSSQPNSEVARTDCVASLASGVLNFPEPPFFRFSEAMQTIQLSLDQVHAHSAAQIIGVTSALPNEGKSTIVAYLAQTMARAGSRVILLDCNFRAAKLTKVFAEQSSIGLQEIVTGRVSTEKALRHNSAGFAFLPVGTGRSPARPNEIFAMPQTRILFEELRKSFDYILVDLPPLGPVTDVGAIGKFVECYLFVIKWGETQTQVVQQALNNMHVVRNNLLGVILNNVDFENLADYERSYDNYEVNWANKCESAI
jgi:succinoglycan biosynthesis transport protein ExoP